MSNKLDPAHLEVWKDAYPGLEFEEKTHTYTVDGEILPSVSTLLKNFYDEFNTEFVAKAYAKKHGFRVKDVKDAWTGKAKISTDRGTLVHLFAEDYAKWKWYGIGKRPKVTCKQTLGALQFLESLPEYIYPIGLEVQMYSKYYGFTGTGDLLLENGKTDEVYWADWKGLPIDTPIATETGWKEIQELTKEDLIFDKNGDLTSIVNISEVHHNPCFEMRFDNGETIISDHEHRWLISFRNNDGSHKEVVMTTEEIREHLKGKLDRNYKIPKIFNAKPLNLPPSDLPIDPYVLGVWLGDGAKASGVIHNSDQRVLDEVSQRGFVLGENISGKELALAKTVYGLATELRKMGLLMNKHIPIEYLRSSYNQRLDLLRGLMDTDGYYNNKRKRFVMSTTQLWQKDDFITLLGSLGWKCTVFPIDRKLNGKIFKSWDICFTTDGINPFLVRNQDSVEYPRTHGNRYRIIKSIEPVDTVPTMCLEVSSPTHTFLAGKSLLVTHNTNESLTSDYKQKPLKIISPKHGLVQDSYGKYCVQLSLYSILLAEVGINTTQRIIVHLRDNPETKKLYTTHRCPDLRDELRPWLEQNKYNFT